MSADGISELAGVAAGAAVVAAGAVRGDGESGDASGEVAAGAVAAVAGIWGSVTDAVAAGAGAGACAAGAPVSAEVTPCNSCGAMAGAAASSLTIGRFGIAGAGAGAGSAAAVALSANATGTAPAAAIMLVETAFQVSFMVLPNRLTARLCLKLRSYWCYSSDTCGGYSTVTAVTGIGYQSRRRDCIGKHRHERHAGVAVGVERHSSVTGSGER